MRIGSLIAKGAATFDVGTVGAPSITFSGSTTTGLFAPGVGQVAISVGAGVNAFELATDGTLTLTTGYASLLPLAGVAGDENAAVSKEWVEDNFVIGDITTLKLEDLSDVTVDSLANGDFIVRTGGVWENRTQAEAQSDLALVPGTNVQVWDDDLDDLAALDASQDDNFIVSDGANWTQETASQARTTLGLISGGAGDIWVEKAGDSMDSAANITFVGGGEPKGLPTTPSGATAATSKAYVDALVTSGTLWRNPIEDPDLVGWSATDPGVVEGDTVWIVTAGGTWGTLSVSADDAVLYDSVGDDWTLIIAITTGDRFLIAGEHGDIDSSLYDLGFRTGDLIEYNGGTINTLAGWDVPSHAYYQTIDFDTAKAGGDDTGLSSTTTYDLDVTVAGSLEQLTFTTAGGTVTYTLLAALIQSALQTATGNNETCTLEVEGHYHVASDPTLTDRIIIADGTNGAGTPLLAALGSEFDIIRAGNEDGTTVLCNNSDSNHFGHTYTYTENDNVWVEISGPGSIEAGVGLEYDGNVLNVNLGPGIWENPNDQVAVELYDEATGAIILTTDGTSREEDDNDSKLQLLLNGSTLTQGSSGLNIPAQGVTETELHTSVAGDGLTGGNGTPLAVRPGQGIEIDTDLVQVDADTDEFEFAGASPAGVLQLKDGGIGDAKLELDYVEVAGDTMTGDLTMDTGAQIFIAGDGTISDPGLAVVGDGDTGLYSVGTNQLGVTAGGALRATFNTTDLSLTVPILVPDGTAGAPSISNVGDTDTGFYFSAANAISASTGSSERFLISATGLMTTGATSAAAYAALVVAGSGIEVPNRQYVDDLVGALSTIKIIDADSDTKVDVEEGADDDTIRMDAGDKPTGYGAVADIFVLNSAGWTVGMGTANVATTAGAPIGFTAGAGNTSGDGGAVDITAGTAGALGAGGAINLYGGAGGATSGAGGAATLWGGSAVGTGAGGAANVYAGSGNSLGGSVNIAAGTSSGGDTGGGVNIGAATGGATSGDGGAVAIYGGDAGGGTAAGGDVVITGGDGSGTVSDAYGGYVTLQAGEAGYLGGKVEVKAGNGVGATAFGGDVVINSGSSDLQSGKITIQCGQSSDGDGGDLRLFAGVSSDASSTGGDIVIGAGSANSNVGGNVILETGDGSVDANDGYLTTISKYVEMIPQSAALSGAEFRMLEATGNGTSYIGHTVNAAITTTVTYEWPEAPGGNGYALISQTDGTMSWLNLGTGLDNSKITDAGSTTAETYIDTDENTDTINSQIGVTGGYPAFEPLNISAGATGTAIKSATGTSADAAGRPITLDAGAGDGTGDGGAISVIAGAAGATSGNGGDIDIKGGYGLTTGGSIRIYGGATSGATGSSVDIRSGTALNKSYSRLLLNSTASGLFGAAGIGGDVAGGEVGLYGANGNGSGSGGDVNIEAGDSTSGTAGNVVIKAGDSTVAGHIEFGTADVSLAVEARFLEASGSGANYIGLKAPTAVSTNRTWVLPANAPSDGYVMKTDGSGNMAWEDLGTLAATHITLDDLSDVVDTAASTSALPSIFVGDGSNKETQVLTPGTNLTGTHSAGADTYTLDVDDVFIANQSGDSFGDTGSGVWTVVSGSRIDAATGAMLRVADLPTAATDVVNKTYADSIAAGLDPKESVHTATNTGEDLLGGGWTGTYSSSGGPENSGAFTLVDLTVNIGGTGANTMGARVLVKNQGDAKQNGIYEVTTTGTSGTLTRAEDQDGNPASEVSGGNFTFVESGDNANTGWVLTGSGTITLNTDALNWTQFTGAGSFTAGIGLSQAANTLDLDIDDLTVATIISTDTVAFHDGNGTPETSGSISRKTTAANFILDLNILTGTVGGALTATDGVLITASDVIEMDITNLGAATIAGADELVFDDGASGSQAKTTVTNFLADLNIANRGYTSSGIMTHSADDTWNAITLAASTTAAKQGITVDVSSYTSGMTIGLDIDNLNAGGQPGDTEKLVVFDGTNNVTTTVDDLATAIAATTNIGDLADVEADSSADGAGNILVADGSNSYDTKKVQHIESVTAQTTVAVSHNIGQKYVIVQCYDDSDIMVMPQSVTLTNTTTTTVVFSPAFTGNIVIMGVPGVV